MNPFAKFKLSRRQINFAFGKIGNVAASCDNIFERLHNCGHRAKWLRTFVLIIAYAGKLTAQVPAQSEKAAQQDDGAASVATPIKDEITVNAIYEVPVNDTMPEANTSVALLQKYLDQFLATKPAMGGNATVGAMDVDFITGHKTAASPNPPTNMLYLIHLERFISEMPANPELDGIKQLLISFRDPTLTILFSKTSMNDQAAVSHASLITLSSQGQVPSEDAYLYYAMPSRRILIQWNYRFTINHGWLTGNPSSMDEVAMAYCTAFLSWDAGRPDPLRPLVINLQFDNYPSDALDTFQATKVKNAMEAKMDSETEILGGNVARFILPYPITAKLYHYPDLPNSVP